jgi:hypothetical protein
LGFGVKYSDRNATNPDQLLKSPGNKWWKGTCNISVYGYVSCVARNNPEFQEGPSIIMLLSNIRKHIFLRQEVTTNSFKKYRI